MRSNNISILFKFIIFSQEEVHGKCAPKHTSCTIDNKSGEYDSIPINIVYAVIHYLLFLYNKINNEYLKKIFTKIFCKTHQIAPFFKILSGEHAPEPPPNKHPPSPLKK